MSGELTVGGDKFIADARRSCGPILECLRNAQKEETKLYCPEAGSPESFLRGKIRKNLSNSCGVGKKFYSPSYRQPTSRCSTCVTRKKIYDKIKLENTPKMLYYRRSDFEFEIHLEMTHTMAQF